MKTKAMKKILKFLYFKFIPIFNVFVKFLYKNRYSDNKEVVLIVYSGRIGDFLVALPYLKKYEKYENTLFLLPIMLKTIAPLVLENTIFYDGKQFTFNFLYRMELYKELSKFNITKSLNASTFGTANDMILGTTSLELVCYEGEYAHYAEINRLLDDKYTKIIKNPFLKLKSTEHISMHLQVIFKEFTDIEYKATSEDYQLLLSRYKDEEGLNKFNLYKKDYIVFVTDSSSAQRSYPLSYWNEIIEKFAKDIQIVLVGVVPIDININNIINLIGKTNILEAFNIISFSKLVVTNETGPAHYAYLSGVPTIAILGGGHFGRFLPWKEYEDILSCVYKQMECFNCGWQCDQVASQEEVVPCISEINPKEINSLLNTFIKVCN